MICKRYFYIYTKSSFIPRTEFAKVGLHGNIILRIITTNLQFISFFYGPLHTLTHNSHKINDIETGHVERTRVKLNVVQQCFSSTILLPSPIQTWYISSRMGDACKVPGPKSNEVRKSTVFSDVFHNLGTFFTNPIFITKSYPQVTVLSMRTKSS